MTLSNPKQFYKHFLKGHEGKLHFAAHSHHFWPDVTREAQLLYWDDCAQLSDKKWDKIFGDVIPQTQKHIAHILNLKNPQQIALAPNTHELSSRLLSLFLGKPKLKILTTTNEFHSWRRQFLRLSELPQVTIEQVDAQNFVSKRSTFLAELKEKLTQNFDLIFLSQVFFDSGCALTDQEILSLVEATPKQTLFVLDGYHGFAALPSDLSQVEGRVFYLGGGYKYAQGGEGVGFMVVPQGDWRPAYTGWFAEYAQLSRPPGAMVGYSDDAMAFMGATQDASGLYRFNAAWNLFDSNGIKVKDIHHYVQNLQQLFLKLLPSHFLNEWNLRPIFETPLNWHGHFLTFEAADLVQAQSCQKQLESIGILIDLRGKRLRFGFGLYQDEGDVRELCQRLQKLAEKN